MAIEAETGQTPAMKSRITLWHRGLVAAASKAVRRRSRRRPAWSSLVGTASRDLGFAEY